MIAVIFVAGAIVFLLALICWRTGVCFLPALRRQHSVELCLLLLHLIQELQRHRGLSVAILDGQTGFHHELDVTDGMLQRSLHALAEQYGKRHPIFSSPRWQNLLGHWESLRNNWRELDVVTNLFAHNEVILELILVLQLLADDQINLIGANRAQIIIQWPPLIEHLGMLRALGVHALSQKNLLEDSRIRLSLADHRQNAMQALIRVSDKIPNADIVGSSKMLLLHIDQLTEGGGPIYSVQAFYEEITTLIDQWYGMITSQINQQL